MGIWSALTCCHQLFLPALAFVWQSLGWRGGMELDLAAPPSVVALLQWVTCRGMSLHLGITHT